jgi:homogentisate phytyltransferase / homogentisate geranylgeranyltransferase
MVSSFIEIEIGSRMGQSAFLKQLQRSLDWLHILWKFSRPHTIIGTSLSVVGLAVIALATLSKDAAAAIYHPGAAAILILEALIPCLGANVYIVGLNQLEDVEIDRINKPSLPLASGVLSRQQGQAIVGVTGILSLVLSSFAGLFLFGTVLASLAIGTAYSLTPIRLKRFPFWAALCIYSVRGLVVNLGLFLHFRQRLGGGNNLPPQIWALTVFVVLFAFAIAIFKDIPDAKGDRQFKVKTLTLQLGPPTVFNLSRWVLTAAYSSMVTITLLGWIPVQPAFLIVTHLASLSLLWIQSFKVDLQQKQDISQFYQFIWKLFFLEYVLFPAACLLKSLS